MTKKRSIEVFSAGCPACQDAIDLVRQLACASCEVTVLDMNDPEVAARARTLGIHRLPAVVVDGVLADCCQGQGVDADRLRALGVGQPA